MKELLRQIPTESLHPVMDCASKRETPYVFDFTEANNELHKIDLNDEEAFTAYIFKTIESNGAAYGIGKYNEDRVIYRRSNVFGTSRSIHLGIDIWTSAGLLIYAPIHGKIHSFRDNDSHGDYGPTIILSHELAGFRFYTLYGHLSKSSLINKRVGQTIPSGSPFASLGAYIENVHWPPHLHFQVILDMQGYKGDYPGVCSPDDREAYLGNCPDPNLLLRIPVLE
jgi:murein DD-endopeptidase MepM/ murein hydrolase activator NlpD